jgi:hypothetical protein
MLQNRGSSKLPTMLATVVFGVALQIQPLARSAVCPMQQTSFDNKESVHG